VADAATQPADSSHERSDGTTPNGMSDTRRVEAFSDGVFAIVITLLVLDLRAPEAAHGTLLAGLGRQWPAYVAYIASFSYVGVIWLNHEAFSRIRRVNRGLQFANLFLLFTTALIPFPTAVVSQTLIEGVGSDDARTAVVFYGIMAAAMCASWLILYAQVDRHHRDLAHEGGQRGFFAADRIRAIVGICGYLVAAVLGWLVMPVIALAVFVILPIFYGLTSQPARGRQTHHDQAVREGPAHRDHHYRHQRFRDRETTDESARAAGDRRHRQPAPARRPTNRPRPDHRGPMPCTPSPHPSPPRPAPASQACAWVSSAAMPCSPRCRCFGSNPTASPTKISAH
jgi:uncharacterized membrane protein